MAKQDPTRPQAIDPEVQANLVRLLRIRGPLGVLNVADVVVPVVSLGNVVTPNINVLQPSFRSTDVFSVGRVLAPAAGTVLADTLNLPEGIFNVIINWSVADSIGNSLQLQHRNAANTANLMQIEWQCVATGVFEMFHSFDNLIFSYELALNERLRIVTFAAGAVSSSYAAVIFARIR